MRGRINLDGGTLNLDGGTRPPPRPPYNLSTGCYHWKQNNLTAGNSKLSLEQLMRCTQGHRGGLGGEMTPGPMGFRKAVGFRRPMSSRGAHQNDTEKSACEA